MGIYSSIVSYCKKKKKQYATNEKNNHVVSSFIMSINYNYNPYIKAITIICIYTQLHELHDTMSYMMSGLLFLNGL